MTSARSISALIDRALVSQGEAWPRAEQAVLEAVAAGESIEPGLSHPDPVGRLLAASVQERAAAGGDDPMRQALAYLDRVEARFRQTAAGVPSVGGVVEILTRAFGPRLSQPLALRLAQQPDLRHWRVMTALAYLDQHKDPAATDAIIRFAARAQLPIQQTAAIHVLRNFGDPLLASKIAAERTRLASTGRSLPSALAVLAGPSDTATA